MLTLRAAVYLILLTLTSTDILSAQEFDALWAAKVAHKSRLRLSCMSGKLNGRRILLSCRPDSKTSSYKGMAWLAYEDAGATGGKQTLFQGRYLITADEDTAGSVRLWINDINEWAGPEGGHVPTAKPGARRIGLSIAVKNNEIPDQAMVHVAYHKRRSDRGRWLRDRLFEGRDTSFNMFRGKGDWNVMKMPIAYWQSPESPGEFEYGTKALKQSSIILQADDGSKVELTLANTLVAGPNVGEARISGRRTVFNFGIRANANYHQLELWAVSHTGRGALVRGCIRFQLDREGSIDDGIVRLSDLHFVDLNGKPIKRSSHEPKLFGLAGGTYRHNVGRSLRPKPAKRPDGLTTLTDALLDRLKLDHTDLKDVRVFVSSDVKLKLTSRGRAARSAEGKERDKRAKDVIVLDRNEPLNLYLTRRSRGLGKYGAMVSFNMIYLQFSPGGLREPYTLRANISEAAITATTRPEKIDVSFPAGKKYEYEVESEGWAHLVVDVSQLKALAKKKSGSVR